MYLISSFSCFFFSFSSLTPVKDLLLTILSDEIPTKTKTSTAWIIKPRLEASTLIGLYGMLQWKGGSFFCQEIKPPNSKSFPIVFPRSLLLFDLDVRGRANANPHYQKFCARVSHVWGNRRPQPQRSAMPGPHPEGAALLITASPAPGKYEVQKATRPRVIGWRCLYTCGCKVSASLERCANAGPATFTLRRTSRQPGSKIKKISRKRVVFFFVFCYLKEREGTLHSFDCGTL